jgi:hypothetical protein
MNWAEESLTLRSELRDKRAEIQRLRDLCPATVIAPSHNRGYIQAMWYYDSQFQSINSRLDTITTMLRQLLKQEAQLAIDLTAATAEIANNTSVEASAVLAIKTLTNLLTAIPPSTDPVTQAALDNLVATLKANDTTLGAAVATTPAAPVAVPPVVVVPPVAPAAARASK